MGLFSAVLCSSLLFSFVRLSTSTAKCTSQSGTCKCSTSDGDIDLSALDNPLNPLVWKPAGNWDYRYNPCSAITCSNLPDVAVCERYTLASAFYNLGTQKSASFKYDPTRDLIYVEYTGSVDSSQVFLKCDQNENGKITAGPTQPKSPYSFTLTSKHCCPVPKGGGGGGSGGLSVGSILLIVFFSLLFAYLVGGVLFLHFVKHETGFDLVPNRQFWITIPGYVKEGCIFTYETINYQIQSRRGYSAK